MSKDSLIELIVGIACNDLDRASMIIGEDFKSREDIEEYLYSGGFTFSELEDTYSFLS